MLIGGTAMGKKIVLMGIDLSKSVFQCHGVNAAGQCNYRKRLSRTKLFEFVSNIPKCTIVVEACGGAHYFARKFQEFGHNAKLIAPQYVKPFVKSNKDDAADAEAIVEAASRPNMQYVPIKQVWQQDLQSIHRVRQRLIRSKTALTNEIRGLLYEYGIVIPKGDSALMSRLSQLLAEDNETVTEMLKSVIQDLLSELIEIKKKILEYETKLSELGKKDNSFKRLNSIKGVGLISITALIIALADPSVFKNGRHFAAWLGLVPKHSGTGGINKNMGISKRGNTYLRSLLVHGARAVVRAVNMKAAKDKNSLDSLERWVHKLYLEKGTNRAAVALANKNARIAWALIAHNTEFDAKLASIPLLKSAA
jgi:transposase